MNLEEAKKYGCPDHIIKKMKKHGVISFSTPHNLDDINWDTIERKTDKLMLNLIPREDIDPQEIETRFEILDL